MFLEHFLKNIHVSRPLNKQLMTFLENPAAISKTNLTYVTKYIFTVKFLSIRSLFQKCVKQRYSIIYMSYISLYLNIFKAFQMSSSLYSLRLSFSFDLSYSHQEVISSKCNAFLHKYSNLSGIHILTDTFQPLASRNIHLSSTHYFFINFINILSLRRIKN